MKENKRLKYTHPEVIDWLLDKKDGDIYSFGCKKKTKWICQNCGNIVDYSIQKVVKYGYVPCKKCSDKISYPNKYMYSLLEQINIDFITEFSPDWIKPKKYDFYIPLYNIIIEMDGALGHGHYNKINDISGEESLQIDQYKDNIAKQNGIEVIRIDCYISDSEYIKNNIIKSVLSKYFNLNDVDFLLCHKNAISSYKMKVCEKWNKTHNIDDILNTFKFSRVTIIKWLKQFSKYNMCDYDPKLQQHNSGKNNISKAYNANKKSVICLETKTKFDSCKEAYMWLGYNVNGHSIQDNCKKIIMSAGKHPETNEKLHWMFYEDYIREGGVAL